MNKPIGQIGHQAAVRLSRPRGQARRANQMASTMQPGVKTQVLRDLTFGNEIAEEERDSLREYFVKTQVWERIYSGDIDVVYGPKGSGKSALYALVNDSSDDLFDRGILLVAAEQPRGTPAFLNLVATPPTSEREFIAIWKLYFASLVVREATDMGINNSTMKEVAAALQQSGLLPTKKTPLGTILSTVRSYCAKYLNPNSLSGGVDLTPLGVPLRADGRITFEQPSIREQTEGFLSVDDLIGQINEALSHAGYTTWLMIDRLDVAFDESSELERNALRALFRTYNDMKSNDNIKIKIFLRTDIWKRITEGGFREATHISRTNTLKWDKPSLQNLVLRRLISNQSVTENYNIDKDAVMSSAEVQQKLFDRIFPEQVEVGEKQSSTMDWIIKRTSGGTNNTQPRDIIILLNRLSAVQNQRIERGEAEPANEWLFERGAFKESLPTLSEYRITQVLFAEYPDLRQYIAALKEQKTEQNADSLARIWDIDRPTAEDIARKLKDVGFFEERTSKGVNTYWVPFVYRSYLDLSQGKVEEILRDNPVQDSEEE